MSRIIYTIRLYAESDSVTRMNRAEALAFMRKNKISIANTNEKGRGWRMWYLLGGAFEINDVCVK